MIELMCEIEKDFVKQKTYRWVFNGIQPFTIDTITFSQIRCIFVYVAMGLRMRSFFFPRILLKSSKALAG